MERKTEAGNMYGANAVSGPLALAKRVEQIVGPLEERRRRSDRRKLLEERHPDRRRTLRREGRWRGE